MSNEPPKDDESEEVNFYDFLWKKPSKAKLSRLPSRMFPWLCNMSVLYGGKVKLTGDDVQKIYGISKKSYDTFVWNLRHCSHYSFYMIFYQAKSDRKHLLQYDDEMNDMERKMKFYKDGYEKTYVKYLKLADRLRKYEDVDL